MVAMVLPHPQIISCCNVVSCRQHQYPTPNAKLLVQPHISTERQLEPGKATKSYKLTCSI
eukprot:3955670-Amphidinium_carterae.1